jgi:hypothetical protein
VVQALVDASWSTWRKNHPDQFLEEGGAEASGQESVASARNPVGLVPADGSPGQAMEPAAG